MKISKQSLIIAAHPDDEVLWFSSVLDHIGHIIFCFHRIDDRPDITQGRQKSYLEFPKPNMHSLRIDESQVFNPENFNRTEETDYGIKLKHSGKAVKKHYITNYSILLDKLRPLLQDADQVFTHNPWGEYGNEEHIQVYRAVKSLQRELAFDIWFPNYFSNRSAGLMAKTIAELHIEFFIERTNQQIAKQLSELYKKNGCWTWSEDWEWPEKEAFIKATFKQDSERKAYKKRVSLPFHSIVLQGPPPKNARSSVAYKIKNKMKKTIDK